MSLRDVPIHTITITSGIDPDDGTATYDVEWNDDLGFVEALGLLEAAKDTIIRTFMED